MSARDRSYERIAARMQTGAGQVAQLLERARINLYDELHGTPLAAVAAPAKECAQALPAIAAREDGELDALPGVDAAWLDRHLAECERCRPAVEQMGEAAAAYRAWSQGEAAPEPAAGPASSGRRRRAALIASTAAVFMFAGVAAVFVVSGNGGAPGLPSQGGGKPASNSDPPSGKAGVGPTQQTASPKPSSRPAPAPTSTQASQPATTTASSPAQVSPAADEEPEAPGRSGEAPGKPANRPPK